MHTKPIPLTQLEVDELDYLKRIRVPFPTLLSKYHGVWNCSCNKCLICYLNGNIKRESLAIR